MNDTGAGQQPKMLFILRGEERGPVYPGYKDLVASALQNNWSVCESIRVCESLSDHESIAETDYCNTEFGNVDTLVALVFITTELCLQLGNKIRAAYPHALIVGLEASSGSVAGTVGCDLYITDFPKAGLVQFLTHAEHYWKSRQLIALHFADLGLKRKQITQLTDIGLALGAQVEPDKLLETILTEARAIANCDAGSLYLVDKSADEPMLVFKLAQNDSIKVKFQETQIRLSDQSIAGYVALSGEELRIADAYQIRSSERYVFNRGFDQNYGYRSQSIVTLPMRDHRGQVTGVIQFINKKSSDGEIIEFDTETIDMLRAIVSQAAIAIQKTNLLNNINQLFEGFVQASIKAIEQRDPSTSGHSFRVSETTTTLLRDVERSGLSRFSGLSVSDDYLREVRYAALLHDFGKVSVREVVLLKANKLSDERLETLKIRFELKKEQLRRIAVERELDLFHHNPVDLQVIRRRIHRDLDKQLSLLKDYYEAIQRANNPSILPDGDFRELQKLHHTEFVSVDGSNSGLISSLDLKSLSIRRGSLTSEERQEIESHVFHTMEFLAVLPWTPELAGVPEIAAAHHEKLNGTGYPLGLAGDEIPLASRIMTVCDIYDALTAMDRPYKSAMSSDFALRILDEEASAGLLDADLVKIFREARSWRVLGDANAGTEVTPLFATH